MLIFTIFDISDPNIYLLFATNNIGIANRPTMDNVFMIIITIGISLCLIGYLLANIDAIPNIDK